MRLWIHFLMVLLGGMPTAFAAELEARGLEAALRATLSNHPAMSGKRAEVSAKEYAGESARARRLPALSGQAGKRSDNLDPVSVRARQPLWTFGRIDSAIAYADADVSVEQADMFRVQRHLLDNTAVAYAKALGLHHRLRVAMENIDQHDLLHQQVARREAGKLASRADVRLTASRLIQARAQKSRIEGELESAMNELMSLTQQSVRADQEIQGSLLELPASSELEAMVEGQSAEMRHKLHLAERTRAEVTQEEKADMPTLFLQAERNFNMPGYMDGTRYSVMLEGSVDGMGFTSAGRLRASQARLDAALEDVKATRNELLRNLRNLLANQHMQAALAAELRESEREVGELLTSFQHQYEAGFKSWQDVLNMQRELFEQRIQRVQAESDWLVYTLRIRALTGGLDGIAGVAKE